MNQFDLLHKIRNTEEYIELITSILKNTKENGPTKMYYLELLSMEGKKLKKLKGELNGEKET